MPSDEIFEHGYRNGRLLKRFLVDVTAAGYDHLLRVLTVAFSDIVGHGYTEDTGSATHMLIDGSRQITFFFAHGELRPPSSFSTTAFDALFDAIQAFPQPIRAQQAADLAWEWLQQLPYPEDEHDGATYEGWRVFNQQFGMVGGHWNAFIAIRPMWIYLSK
jgi:hypothetical protein